MLDQEDRRPSDWVEFLEQRYCSPLSLDLYMNFNLAFEFDKMVFLPIKGKLADRMEGGSEYYNAFYYSLVSTDTQVFFGFKFCTQDLIVDGISIFYSGNVLLSKETAVLD